MEIEVKMPDLSTTGGEVTVLKWLVAVGDSVRRGQALFEVETDKATMEVESVHTGVLKNRLAQPHQSVAPGDVVAVMEVQQPNSATPVALRDQHEEPGRLQVGGDLPAGVNASPAISNMPVPRIGMFAKNRSAAGNRAGATTVALSKTQRAVANRMLHSKQTIPHFYLQTSVRMDSICSQRAQGGDKSIAWDAFFVCAVAKSLKRFPKMCDRIQDDALVSQPRGTIGVAVDIDGELYVVPVVEASLKTPVQVSAEIRDVCQRLKADAVDEEAKRLQPADITITNLGMTAVDSFVPIINPPEAAILAIGRIQPQPVVVGPQIIVEQSATLTLAVDHRIVNGKYAADFLSNIVEELENA